METYLLKINVAYWMKENPTVVSMAGVYADLDAEALRVVSTSPKWTPGTQNGKPVAVKYVVPVSFQIPAPKDAEQK